MNVGDCPLLVRAVLLPIVAAGTVVFLVVFAAASAVDVVLAAWRRLR